MAGDVPFNPVEDPERSRSMNPYRAIARVAAMLAAISLAALACRSWVNNVLESRAVEATSHDPEVAVRQEKVVHGVRWGLSYEAALEQAEATDTPVLVFFTAVTDPIRIEFETNVLADAQVTPLLTQFIRVELNKDYVPIGTLSMPHQMKLARKNVALQLNVTGTSATPSLMIMTPLGDFVTKRDGYQTPRDLAAFLKRALAQARHQAKAQRATP